MTHRSFSAPHRVLLGPGPSDVSRRVLEAMAKPTIGHLDPAFLGLMDEIKAMLRYAFQTENRLTLPISGPGTVGMETCLANLIEPGDRIAVCQNGVFGARMRQMAERCGGQVIEICDPWGRAIDVDRVEQTLRDHPDVKALAFVHAETSTGVLSDARALAEVAQHHGCLTIVDAVTSLGGSPLYVDRWGLDAVYSGTQKCLSCAPGLSPVTLSDRAVAAIHMRRSPVQSWFMDLGLVMSYWEGSGARTYHHTAPVNALYGLHEALLMLREEGLEPAWARHRRCHRALVAGLEAIGLEMLVPPAERSPQLNAVRIPPGVDDAVVRQRLLLEHDLEIGAGLGELAGKIWRIGLMGHGCNERNVVHCLYSLESVLPTVRDVADNRGVNAVRQALA